MEGSTLGTVQGGVDEDAGAGLLKGREASKQLRWGALSLLGVDWAVQALSG